MFIASALPLNRNDKNDINRNTAIQINSKPKTNRMVSPLRIMFIQDVFQDIELLVFDFLARLFFFEVVVFFLLFVVILLKALCLI